jgi:anti-sigma B factor antagonist
MRYESKDSTLTLYYEGQINSANAPALETDSLAALMQTKPEHVVIDCGTLEYISSAGLRVLLSAQKIMNKQGSMTITHVNETVMEIFEVTGFSDILTIE